MSSGSKMNQSIESNLTNSKSEAVDTSTSQSQTVDASTSQSQTVDASTSQSQTVDTSTSQSQAVDAASHSGDANPDSQSHAASGQDVPRALRFQTATARVFPWIAVDPFIRQQIFDLQRVEQHARSVMVLQSGLASPQAADIPPPRQLTSATEPPIQQGPLTYRLWYQQIWWTQVASSYFGAEFILQSCKEAWFSTSHSELTLQDDIHSYYSQLRVAKSSIKNIKLAASFFLRFVDKKDKDNESLSQMISECFDLVSAFSEEVNNRLEYCRERLGLNRSRAEE